MFKQLQVFKLNKPTTCIKLNEISYAMNMSVVEEINHIQKWPQRFNVRNKILRQKFFPHVLIQISTNISRPIIQRVE